MVCHYFDHTLETVVGNAICAEGGATFLLSAGPGGGSSYPEVVNFGSFLDPDHLDKVGFEQLGASYESLSHLPSEN